MRLLILYGSETGNAKDYAEMIWRQSLAYGFSGPVMTMNDYNIQNIIEENLIVFVCSTTGQGNEPENMKKFWKFLLRKNLPSSSLKDLNFACLGLGDSSYEFYNYVAKRLRKRLLNLSAKELIPIGLCDDQHDYGIGATAIPWLSNLWNTLGTLYPIEYKPTKEFISKYSVTVCPEPFENEGFPLNRIDEYATEFEVEKNERATSNDHFQDVRYLSFKNEGIKWDCGDVLSIYPSNSKENVDKLFEILQDLPFKRTTFVTFEELHQEMPIPKAFQLPMSLETLATYFWDLSAMPRQRVFEILLTNCEDEMESWKLGEFIKSEGLEDVINYVNRPRRTILEVLFDFPNSVNSLKLPQLIELFQIISPRSYSIASYPDMSIEILVAVVEYKTKLKDLRRGLCTTFLKNLKPGDKVLCSIKKGTLKIPSNDYEDPLILIGPGTGFAPFRSVLLKKEMGMLRMPLYTIFGCRNKLKDFFYEEDFKRFEQKQVTTKSFFAFSRDQDHKVYVQHLIKENGEYFKDLILNKNASIFVAGASGSMPKAVKETFSEILNNDKNCLNLMIKNNRYFEETWS